MELAIPCQSENQYIEVTNKLKRIKSDFLLKIHQESLQEWLNNGDFEALKAELKGIVNDHLEQPVETIY